MKSPTNDDPSCRNIFFFLLNRDAPDSDWPDIRLSILPDTGYPAGFKDFILLLLILTKHQITPSCLIHCAIKVFFTKTLQKMLNNSLWEEKLGSHSSLSLIKHCLNSSFDFTNFNLSSQICLYTLNNCMAVVTSVQKM